MYDPITGQWLSRDPLGEKESLNLYSLTGNDPINYVDVDGLWRINTQEAANDQRVEWLLMQLSAGSGLPTAPLDEWKLYFPERGNLGLFKPYGPEDYKRAQTFVQNLGRPGIRSMTSEEAEVANRPSFSPKPEWIPSATGALTLGAANTPLNASINSDWLLPTGAGGLGARFAFGSLKGLLPALVTGAKVEGRVIAAEMRAGELSRSVFHTVTSRDAGLGVLKGIDPAFLNPNSRFGKALYTSDDFGTTLAELVHHGATGTHTIRYNLNMNKAKILDFTNPSVAKAWGYTGGSITPATKTIGTQAIEAGYNVIKFPSLRGPGTNYGVLSNFDELLSPLMPTP